MLVITPISYSHAICSQDLDFPTKPCDDYGIPFTELRDGWNQYAEHKGEAWMEIKKIELDQAIASDNLENWITSGYNTTNHNIWYYYYLNDQAPHYLDGRYISEKISSIYERYSPVTIILTILILVLVGIIVGILFVVKIGYQKIKKKKHGESK